MSYRVVAILLFATPLFAQFRTNVVEKVPAGIKVREFIRQDYLGGRLSAAGWARMKPLTTWSENPDWKDFRVIARYELMGAAESVRNAKAVVHYQVLGRFVDGIGFEPIGSSEDIEFRLKQIDGEWKIDSTDDDRFEPRVSRQSALQWLQAQLPKAKSPAEKLSIEQALKEIQKPQPPVR